MSNTQRKKLKAFLIWILGKKQSSFYKYDNIKHPAYKEENMVAAKARKSIFYNRRTKLMGIPKSSPSRYRGCGELFLV